MQLGHQLFRRRSAASCSESGLAASVGGKMSPVASFVFFITSCALMLSMTSAITDPNATISFFFTADPQFGWGNSYSGNEER